MTCTVSFVTDHYNFYNLIYTKLAGSFQVNSCSNFGFFRNILCNKPIRSQKPAFIRHFCGGFIRHFCGGFIRHFCGGFIRQKFGGFIPDFSKPQRKK
jgi:hypothetical protein